MARQTASGVNPDDPVANVLTTRVKDAKTIDGCLQLLGGCHGGPDRKYKVLETDAAIADRMHPIATGIKDFRVHDEFFTFA